jgi:small subunit ribosomal protein S3
MGRKVHPLGFRIGVIRDWQAKWHADKHYAKFLHEDLQLREAIGSKYTDTGISLVEIERQANKVSVTIYTARPGIVIGRGGQRVDEMRHYLEDLISKRVQLNIQEIRQPELDAYLVARTVAEQIQRRVAYRRALKQALFRTMQAGAKGMKICCSGRLGGTEIARREMMHRGQVPLHTLRADIDYGFTEARTTLGRIGIKVWINRGEILPELKEVAADAEVPDGATASAVTEVASPLVEEAETKPAEAATKEAVAEEKPAKLKAKRTRVVKPSVAKEAVAEEKPAKPRVKRTRVVKPSVAKEAVAEEKPAKLKVRRARKAKPSAVVEEEETNATTETSEIQKES